MLRRKAREFSSVAQELSRSTIASLIALTSMRILRSLADSMASGPDKDVGDVATRIMERMVRMPPERHKDAMKPTTAQAEAQRRRREKERNERPASNGRVHKGKSRA